MVDALSWDSVPCLVEKKAKTACAVKQLAVSGIGGGTNTFLFWLMSGQGRDYGMKSGFINKPTLSISLEHLKGIRGGKCGY